MKKCSEEIRHGKTMKDNHKVSEYVHRSIYETESSLMIRQLRKMNHVERLSGMRKNSKYSLTEHCYHTAILFQEIAKSEGINITLEQFEWVMKHDALETVTGDVLFPAKNYNESTKKLWRQIEKNLTSGATYCFLEKYTDHKIKEILPDNLITIFKIADIMELYIFCREEQYSGNLSGEITGTIANCVNILLKNENIEFQYVRDFLHREGYPTC